MDSLIHGSLFTGIGGFDLAGDRVGIKTLWQVEIDPKAQQTLAAHWPDTERINDVREVTRGTGAVDLVTGGFPCQDLSVAGRRAGLAGKRSGLWFEFRRILAEIKPRWVVVENVPGLLSSDGGRDFAVVLRGLVELGYGVCWRILDAQYFGVAQRRRRVFIVGSLGDFSCAQVLFEPASVCGDTPPVRKAGSPALTLFASDAGTNRTASAGSEADFCIVPEQEVATPITADLSKTYVPNDTKTGRPSNLVVAATVTGAEAHNGNSNPIANNLIVNCLDGAQGGPDDNSAQAGHLVPQAGVRRLTPTECECLQGFPDGWTAMHADTVRYRQLGNAVAVPVAEWIMKRIVEYA